MLSQLGTAGQPLAVYDQSCEKRGAGTNESTGSSLVDGLFLKGLSRSCSMKMRIRWYPKHCHGGLGILFAVLGGAVLVAALSLGNPSTLEAQPYPPPPEGDRPYTPPSEYDRPYPPPSGYDRRYPPPRGYDRPYPPRPPGEYRPYPPPQGDGYYPPPSDSDRPYPPPSGYDRPYPPPQ